MNNSSQLVWSWEGEPFGSIPANENVNPTTTFTYNLRFPGQYYDRETGLHQNRWREYDPKQGKYLQSDPIGLAAGVNTYAYVESSPLMFIDPLGLCPCGNAQTLIMLAKMDERDWSYSADRREINKGFGVATNKCNLFVDTQFEAAGYHLPNVGGGCFSQLFRAYPPGAKSLSDPLFQISG